MFEFETFGGFENIQEDLCCASHASPRETGGPVVKPVPQPDKTEAVTKTDNGEENAVMQGKEENNL